MWQTWQAVAFPPPPCLSRNFVKGLFPFDPSGWQTLQVPMVFALLCYWMDWKWSGFSSAGSSAMLVGTIAWGLP